MSAVDGGWTRTLGVVELRDQDPRGGRAMRGRRWLWWVWVVGPTSLAGIILAVWKLPSLLYGDASQASADARLQAASGFRTAVIAGLAGLAALGGLVTAARTYRLTQQGQITDRYTKAIEQLGSDKREVWLGGIYALERIAKDSAQDGATIAEVLRAFIRGRGPLAAQPTGPAQRGHTNQGKSPSCAIERPTCRRH